MAISLRRLVIVALAVWMLVLMYISCIQMDTDPNRHRSTITDSENIRKEYLKAVDEQLEQASSKLDGLRKQNDQLKSLLFESSERWAKNLESGSLLSTEEARNDMNQYAHRSWKHEELRRKIKSGIQELWHYLNGGLTQMNQTVHWEKLNGSVLDDFQRFTRVCACKRHSLCREMFVSRHVFPDCSARNHYRSVLATMDEWTEVDGSRQYRAEKLESLAQLMKRRLQHLQNPSDCQTARVAVCELDKHCGFACQMHHVTFCLMLSYGTQRTMILKSDGHDWSYSSKGWTNVYQNVSNCSYTEVALRTIQFETNEHKSTVVPLEKFLKHLYKDDQEDLVIKIPIIDNYASFYRPSYLPPSFPTEFAEQLLQLHGYPPAWWIGLFASYLMRPNAQMADKLKQHSQHIINGEPIVGVHVRRTDKVTNEADMHSLDKYMRWVDHYFEILRFRQGKSTINKRCYLASDDPTVLKDAEKSYPEYQFYADAEVMKGAAFETRYSEESLYGVMKDVTILSQTDFLVCTFSSQVCRLAYELMQMRGDYGDRFHSLDDVFYFGGQDRHLVEVILDHKSGGNRELTVAKGEELHLLGNHWDGYSRALLGDIDGLIPSYKIREKWRIVDYPTYPEVTV